MKIQDMAIIFVLIILPISLVLSAYTQYQIQTLNTQTLYDTQLTAATYDAIKAYQINAENSTTSELSNSKVRDIEASVSTFKNSIMSTFRLNGYSEEELDNYIPALVYTMYDGFYIYSPYENVNYQYEEKKDASGNPIKDADGNIEYDTTKPTQGNGENIYGLKPYIPYSCRYKKGTIDVIITYALDNYITIQGMIDGKYVNESGYLIDGIQIEGDTVKYNGITIKSEQLKEYFIGSAEYGISEGVYPYVKLNGTKYYKVKINSADPEDSDGHNAIIYLSNGTPKVQCRNTGNPDDEYSKYKNFIENNTQAIRYYKNAKKFTDKVRSITDLNLTELTYDEAYDIYGNKLWPGNTTKIFTGTTNIENESSNFNQHRLEVIRHTIESNLSLAIANYNKYSQSTTNDFQMPKLKEDEWDYITHNISLISFLQGLNIGGKIYNGYTIVTNSESKEVVLEPNIYILGKDSSVKKTYHKIGDKELENTTISVDIGNYTGETDSRSSGRLNLDFKRKLVIDNNNTKYYYPLRDYNASYTSVVMQDKVNPKSYDDIYEYIDTECEDDVKTAFYIALARERQAQYKSNFTSIETTTPTIPTTPTESTEPTTCTIIYDENGGSEALPSQTVTYLSPTILSTQIPSRLGYDFVGWAKDSTATIAQYSAGDTVIAEEDMTLYAVWKYRPYPYIPTGFRPEEGTNLEDGFTIQDSLGNQYVWIEVPQTTGVYQTAGLYITVFTNIEYGLIEDDLHKYISTYEGGGDGYTDTYYSDDVTGLTETEYNELKQKMLKSVYQNGGFYVGKYETGIENSYRTSNSAPTEIPVIKQNAFPYVNVTSKQAQTLASNMASGEYTSSLMFGLQWKLVLKYLETKGATQDELKSDSTNWGNYRNNNWTISNANSKYFYAGTWINGLYNETGKKGDTSTAILLSTGASDDFSKQGIYDLAGNALEWTMESSGSSAMPCVFRGGGIYNNGSTTANSPVCHEMNSTYGIVGFRVAIY